MDASSLECLEPFIGEWSVAPDFPNAPPTDLRGRTAWEWMPGRRFLIQRWDVPDPAPDGIAIIGYDERRGSLIQHYFDSRGVARIYVMSFDDGVWRLSRTEADFSPLSFSQRFVGEFRDDGATIAGRWETSNDGSTWELDFDLTYTRMG